MARSENSEAVSSANSVKTQVLIAAAAKKVHTIEVLAPIDGKWNAIGEKEDLIRIKVRELKGKELGALAWPNSAQYVERAVQRKSQEDKAAYGKTTAELRQDSIDNGYYSSQAHLAWALAAEARTAGKLSAAWWMKFDPYGGTAGNGPDIMLTGAYPGVLSKIGMAHDTDWSLGRHFQAGPLRGLYGANYNAETLGKYGLDPTSPIKPGVGVYSFGHPDWNVQYTQAIRRAHSGQSADEFASDPTYRGPLSNLVQIIATSTDTFNVDMSGKQPVIYGRGNERLAALTEGTSFEDIKTMLMAPGNAFAGKGEHVTPAAVLSASAAKLPDVDHPKHNFA